MAEIQDRYKNLPYRVGVGIVPDIPDVADIPLDDEKQTFSEIFESLKTSWALKML